MRRKGLSVMTSLGGQGQGGAESGPYTMRSKDQVIFAALRGIQRDMGPNPWTRALQTIITHSENSIPSIGQVTLLLIASSFVLHMLSKNDLLLS